MDTDRQRDWNRQRSTEKRPTWTQTDQDRCRQTEINRDRQRETDIDTERPRLIANLSKNLWFAASVQVELPISEGCEDQSPPTLGWSAGVTNPSICSVGVSIGLWTLRNVTPFVFTTLRWTYVTPSVFTNILKWTLCYSFSCYQCFEMLLLH